MSYSIDFRRKVLSVRESEGLTISEVAARFCIGIATVVRWLKRVEPIEKRHKPATKIDIVALARDIRTFPDAYHYERAQRLGASRAGICHAMQRLGVTYKKNASAPKGKRRITSIVPKHD